jgi:hypothetical protein
MRKGTEMCMANEIKQLGTSEYFEAEQRNEKSLLYLEREQLKEPEGFVEVIKCYTYIVLLPLSLGNILRYKFYPHGLPDAPYPLCW